MMSSGRQIVALYFSERGQISLNNLLCRLRNQELQTRSVPIKILVQRFHVLQSEKLVCSESSAEWSDIHDCVLSTELNKENQKNISLSETLFQITDTLHITGSLTDVIFEYPHELKANSESFLPLCGVLGHLKEWFNACVTTVVHPDLLGDLDEGHRQLCSFVKAKAVGCFEDFENNREDVWRGKVSVIDKTVNRGFVFPGFTMKRHHADSEEAGPCIWGRMLEVLDEVDIGTIPPYMLTDQVYHLCLNDLHSHSLAFVEQVKEEHQTGLIARLACYKNPPEGCPSNHYLSSATWKESIMANVMFVQEPEEELAPGYNFMHFLITSTPRCKNDQEHTLIIRKLCPTECLNGAVLNFLFRQGMRLSTKTTDVYHDDLLSGLPVMDADILEEFHAILWKKQTEALQNLLKERQNSNKDDKVEVGEIRELLTNIHMTLLQSLKSYLPKFEANTCQSLTHDTSTQCLSELETNPTEWHERKLLIFCESQKRTLSRLQSTDSVALSSPIQPCQEPTSIDIKDLLKLFKPDGTANTENLSPIRKKRQGRCKKSVVPNTEDLGQDTIPTYLQSCCHDIYLNKDRKGERLDTHKQKLQERYIKDETHSSCSVPLFSLGKKKSTCTSPRKGMKGLKSPVGVKKVTKSSLKTLRKSPRKNTHSQSTNVLSKCLKSPQKSHSLDTEAKLSPHKPKTEPNMLSLRRSPRKAVPRTLLSQHRRHSLYEEGTRRDHTEPSTKPKQSRLSLSEMDTRRKSSTSQGHGDAKEQQLSRSERHKKKLLDIVAEVLQKNGVDTNSSLYKSCATRLYKVTKLYVMDLPTSENLRHEMRRIAEGQVQQVIDVETRRQSIGGKESEGR